MGTELPTNVAEALIKTVKDVRDTGSAVDSAGDGRGFVELLGYTTGMSNPLARIGAGQRPLPTVGAVARFVWLVSGSDRLEDIAYYESRVRTYTDDGLTVPGSSYGKRIFNASPGTNQMRGVVDELKANPDSRRAAAVVWLPEDAVRTSNDIPCTFGLFFHVRAGALTMTTVMRSNNAVTLVPYNFFEFSMIGEMVAAELDVPFERYIHWAASMHTIDAQNELRDQVLAISEPRAITMPEMPRGGALEMANSLAAYEARLRHAGTAEELVELANEARDVLGEYWAGFFNVLYVHGLAKRGMRAEAWEEFERIPSYFQLGAKGAIEKVLGPEPLDTSSTDALFSLDVIEPLTAGHGAAQVAMGASKADDVDWLLSALGDLSTPERPVTLDELVSVREVLRQDDVALAARLGDKPQDVADALARVRESGGS
ncbi:thymidylate synthase [Microbacter sp. GSS18]|nr:thymidylate synthase [Microbacter sp. GSS18]